MLKVKGNMAKDRKTSSVQCGKMRPMYLLLTGGNDTVPFSVRYGGGMRSAEYHL